MEQNGRSVFLTADPLWKFHFLTYCIDYCLLYIRTHILLQNATRAYLKRKVSILKKKSGKNEYQILFNYLEYLTEESLIIFYFLVLLFFFKDTLLILMPTGTNTVYLRWEKWTVLLIGA